MGEERWNARLARLRADLEQHVREHPDSTLRVVPKGIHAPAFRRTVREIRSLEQDIGLRVCASCRESVIEGDNPGSQMHTLCSACFRGIEQPPAA